MDLSQTNTIATLIETIEGIDWRSLRSDQQTWILRALIKSAREWQVSHDLEVTIGSVIAQSSGFCHCCRLQVVFSSSDGWLRDHYACSNCGSVPRERNIMRALDELVPAWTDKTIHESSPSNMRLRDFASNYKYSFYEPGVDSGARLPNGGTSENLERLSISSNTLDVFITQDVLEHVFDPEASVKEVMRTLRVGGWYLFTTPRSPYLGESVRRAKLVDGEVVNVLPPEYHGSPIGDGRVLVTFDWGQDLESLLSTWSAEEVITRDTRDQSRGIDGEAFEVFAIKKTRSYS